MVDILSYSRRCKYFLFIIFMIHIVSLISNCSHVILCDNKVTHRWTQPFLVKSIVQHILHYNGWGLSYLKAKLKSDIDFDLFRLCFSLCRCCFPCVDCTVVWLYTWAGRGWVAQCSVYREGSLTEAGGAWCSQCIALYSSLVSISEMVHNNITIVTESLLTYISL